MRNAFIDELVKLARVNGQIALVVGDLGYSVVERFAEEFPSRFLNAGVAEQNMMGLAAGMASEGYHVFAYSIANFPTFRCAEQIRNDVDYHRLPVTIVAVGGGLSYGSLGYSHHAVQDYALLRSFPNMLIAAPGDPFEVRSCLRYLVDNPQPSYLRIGKAGEPCYHLLPPELIAGKWVKVKEGIRTDLAILTTGSALKHGLKMVGESEYEGCCVFTLPLWGMGYKCMQANQIGNFERITTIEDHLLDGGFGSWLLESLDSTPQMRSRVRIKAIDSKVCAMVGSQDSLELEGGL